MESAKIDHFFNTEFALSLQKLHITMDKIG